MDGDRKPRLFLESRFNLTYPEFSPDGHWMAYVSNESGSGRSVCAALPWSRREDPDLDGRREQSRSGPRMAANSSTDASTGSDQGFFSAAIRSLSPFLADTPRLLFEMKAGEYAFDVAHPRLGVSAPTASGSFCLRFIESTDKPVTMMHVVLNWAEELKRLVPAK